MRTLRLLIITVVLSSIMSSCLKMEREFQVMPVTFYVRQNGFGENATFIPVMRIQGSEPLKSATVKWGDLTYSCERVGDAPDYMDMGYIYGMQAFDTIPNGTYAITAINANNETASNYVILNTKKKLGELKVGELVYNPTTGISAKWQEVTNATLYCVAIRYNQMGSPSMWMLQTWQGGNNKTEGSYNATFAKGTSIQAAVAAFNEGVAVIGDPINIKWGE